MEYNKQLSKVSVHTYKLRNTREEKQPNMNIVIDPEMEELDDFLLKNQTSYKESPFNKFESTSIKKLQKNILQLDNLSPASRKNPQKPKQSNHSLQQTMSMQKNLPNDKNVTAILNESANLSHHSKESILNELEGQNGRQSKLKQSALNKSLREQQNRQMEVIEEGPSHNHLESMVEEKPSAEQRFFPSDQLERKTSKEQALKKTEKADVTNADFQNEEKEKKQVEERRKQELENEILRDKIKEDLRSDIDDLANYNFTFEYLQMFGFPSILTVAGQNFQHRLCRLQSTLERATDRFN